MIKFVFKKLAKKEFGKLTEDEKNRVLKKLKALKYHPNIFSIIGKIEQMYPATHRLRIGSLRLLLYLEKKKKTYKVSILKIGHRKDIYK